MCWLAIFISAALLVGCTNRDLTDLEAYVADVRARPPSGISPPPQPAEVETYFYVTDDRRNPFIPDTNPEEGVGMAADSGIRPDFNRRKEKLEACPLDSLRMVGTLERDGRTWALVKAGDGTIYRVTTGNHMGRNYGRIVEIAEDRIKLVELIRSVSGYQEHETAVSLVVEGG